jgi:hypothetical protein
MHHDHLIADGQRVRWDAGTRTRIGRVRSVNAIPLGYEVKVKGLRNTEGAVVAEEIEAKPNGAALFEAVRSPRSIRSRTSGWREGQMFEPQPDGRGTAIGRVVDSGEKVQRVRRIMRRLVPPYVNPNALRVRVVETREWNAAAMESGAIWVSSGLIDARTDDELAIVLGHELAHYTHEHSRRKAKRNMWGQLVAIVANEALPSIKSEASRKRRSWRPRCPCRHGRPATTGKPQIKPTEWAFVTLTKPATTSRWVRRYGPGGAISTEKWTRSAHSSSEHTPYPQIAFAILRGVNLELSGGIELCGNN